MVVKGTAFKKSSIRTVKSTKIRFVAIIFISFLGAGVFAGFAAVSPNMQRAGDEYYDSQNVMDIRLLSTYGFSDEDAKKVSKTEGVSGVMAGYTIDATGTVGDKDYTFRINSLPKDDDESDPSYINHLSLVAGNWPQGKDEAIIIRPSIGLKNINLGSIVYLDKNSNDRFSDNLNGAQYKITGIAESPYYLSFMQGNTNIGSGMIDYVLYVPQGNFTSENYTDMYVTVYGAKDLNTFDDAYFDKVDETLTKLEALATERQTLLYDEYVSKLDEAKAEYSSSKSESKKKIADAETLIQEQEQKLDASKETYNKNLAAYNSQSEYAKKQLKSVKAQLDSTAAQIAEAEKELDAKKEELEKAKTNADTSLSDAETQIDSSEQLLKELGKPKWYVLDRHMNETFVTYEDDTQRMQDLATVFPLIFFIVASLVCLTTMTRMVDEERTLIGTFKALGYSNGKVAGRYLKYAVSASLIGSVAGICFGFYLLPTIVWNAYGIVFALPDMTPKFYWKIGSLSVLATVLVITLSTGIAVKSSLHETAAGLMRPKAPKVGKRVLLEHIKPIWNHISFSKKVTVRNLGLNKKRLFMTLIGIVGCTALVVTAFGAKDAVRAITNNQFSEIFHYDVTVGFNGGTPSKELSQAMENKDYFSGYTEIYKNAAEVSLPDNEDDDYTVYIMSPKDSTAFTDYVSIVDPDTKEENTFVRDFGNYIKATKNGSFLSRDTLDFVKDNIENVREKVQDLLGYTDKSVVITEKLAMNLDVEVGDTIMVKYLDNSELHPVIITGITKNYAFNYVYIGKDAYKTMFGEEPEYNHYIASISDEKTNDDVDTYLSSVEGVGAISFTDDLMGNVKTSIKSVNNIIWILIISAALLAFTVLYNLTNINIGERQREIATLKVLGFYDKETYRYIFRETVILSGIGCILGLFFGIYLYRAVIETVEPDMILLSRDITWLGYVGTAIMTMLYTWIVDLFMRPRINNIDMLESLKSIE